MSPQARFRRGLLKCLYSWHCHSRTLKKTADWYFGKTYSSFYCNSRKLKYIFYTIIQPLYRYMSQHLSDFFIRQESHHFQCRLLLNCNVLNSVNYAAISIFIRFLGCSSLNISACFFAAICIYICVVLIELCPSICCTQLISTPSSIK